MSKMPVLFVGHGSPMNAIEDNQYTKSWKSIAERIPKPGDPVCFSSLVYKRDENYERRGPQNDTRHVRLPERIV